MSTPRSKFFQRMIKEKPSENIEDRRAERLRSRIAPWNSAGYTGDLEEDGEGPDLNKPVPRGAPMFDSQQKVMKARADMARMKSYEPKRSRILRRIKP